MKMFRSLPLVFAAIAVIAAAPPLFSGCASTGGVTQANAQNVLTSIASSPQAKTALSAAANILGTVGTAFIASEAQKELGVKGVNVGQATSQSLWTSVNALNSSGQIASFISSLGMPSTGSAAATVVGSTPTPAQVSAVASVISTVAGAPPVAGKTTSQTAFARKDQFAHSTQGKRFLQEKYFAMLERSFLEDVGTGEIR